MADAQLGHSRHDDRRGVFTRWFMSTNHKDIRLLYLITSAVVGLIAVMMSVYMRMELMYPGVQLICQEGARLLPATAGDCTPNGHLYNVFFSYHGILMTSGWARSAGGTIRNGPDRCISGGCSRGSC